MESILLTTIFFVLCLLCVESFINPCSRSKEAEPEGTNLEIYFPLNETSFKFYKKNGTVEQKLYTCTYNETYSCDEDPVDICYPPEKNSVQEPPDLNSGAVRMPTQYLNQGTTNLLTDKDELETSAVKERVCSETDLCYVTGPLSRTQHGTEMKLLHFDNPQTTNASCLIEVYYIPSPVTSNTIQCQTPTIEMEGSSESPVLFLLIQCSVDDIFPEAVCKFRFTHNQMSETTTMESDMGEPVKHEWPWSYYRKCTTKLPVKEFLKATYTFSLEAHPNVQSPIPSAAILSVSLDYTVETPKASCNLPVISNDAEWMTVECYTDSSFSNYNCRFRSSFDNAISSEIVDGQAFPPLCHGSPASCLSRCGTKRLVSEMVPGTYRFSVNMTATLIHVQVSAVSQWDSYITLVSPVARISSFPTGYLKDGTVATATCQMTTLGNPHGSLYWEHSNGTVIMTGQPVAPVARISSFPTGYLKDGTVATATCQMTTLGNPHGSLYWEHSNGTVLMTGQPGETTLKLSFSYDKNDNNQEYFCYAKSSLNSSPVKHSLRPTFAYGPHSVQIMPPNEFKFTRCPGSSPMLISCDVDLNQVSPSSTANLEIIGYANFENQTVTEESGYLKTYFEVWPNVAGEHEVKCTAVNTLHNDFQASAQKPIIVYDPPSDPPVLSVDGSVTIQTGSTYSVIADRSIDVTCRVFGGYPVVTSVTVDCAGHTKTGSGNLVTMTLVATRELHKQKCTCRAVHLSQCYSLQSGFYLDVKYPAQIQTFNIGTEASRLEVQDGVFAAIVCQAEGHPKPSLLVRRQRTGQSVLTTGTEVSEMEVRVEKSVTLGCLDTDSYECVANNGVGGESTRSILVYVQCSVALQSGEAIKKTAQANAGQSLTVEFKVNGYPAPKIFSLVKVDSSKRRRKRAVSSGEEMNPSRYRATYVPGASDSSGKIVLVIDEVESSDNGQYVLTADNGVGDRLEAKLDVNVESKGGSGGLSGGILAVIIVIPILLVIIIAILFWCYLQRKEDEKQTPMTYFDNVEQTPHGMAVISKSMNPEDYPTRIPRVSAEGSTRSSFHKTFNVLYR